MGSNKELPPLGARIAGGDRPMVHVSGSRRWLRAQIREIQRAERLVRRILAAMLEHRGFQAYWFPCDQRDLAVEDLLDPGGVPGEVIRLVREELETSG